MLFQEGKLPNSFGGFDFPKTLMTLLSDDIILVDSVE